MTEEELKIKEAAEANIKEIAKKSAEEAAKLEVKVVTEKAATDKAEFQRQMSEMQARIKEMQQMGVGEKQKSFNYYLEEAIKEKADEIRGLKKGSELTLTLKQAGDMSIGGNFPNGTPLIQNVNQGLIWNPYNRIWLSDLLPSATSTANSVLYPKEDGGEGAVGVWDGDGDKAQVDYNFDTHAAFFKWIAGWVQIDREMLDDISWLIAYLQQKLLISLKTAENSFILNGTADANPVEGILAEATAYNGTYTDAPSQIIDAGFGQIVEDTHDFYVPTTAILNPRDTVKIGLNKAKGSGEFDLPSGSVGFVNGKVSIGGLDTVSTTGITKGNFLVFDRNAVMFLRRINPEIRIFEDAALAKKNKIMIRIEERVTQAIFNKNAFVKGTFS